MPSDMRFVVRELAALVRMDEGMLRAWYGAVFGDATTKRSAATLRHRLAWWIQWQAEDGFSERTLARIAELRARSPGQRHRCARSPTDPVRRESDGFRALARRPVG